MVDGVQGAIILTQMNNVLLMHVFNTLTYLPHVVNDLSLRHNIALSCDPLKQFTSRQAAGREKRSGYNTHFSSNYLGLLISS